MRALVVLIERSHIMISSGSLCYLVEIVDHWAVQSMKNCLWRHFAWGQRLFLGSLELKISPRQLARKVVTFTVGSCSRTGACKTS